MITVATRVATFEQVSSVLHALAAFVTATRIYGADHPRGERALVQLRGLIDSLPDGTRVLADDAGLIWEGLPLGNSSAFAAVHACLRRREAAGLEFRAGGSFHTARWLASDGGGARPPADTIVLLDSLHEAVIHPHPELAERLPEFRESLALYDETVRGLESVMIAGGTQGVLDTDAIGRIARRVARSVCRHGLRVLAPIELLQQSTYTWRHSVNVFLIATGVLQSLARDEEELAAFAEAALLHDVGKAVIPEEILNKPGELTPGEREVMERHTEEGARILLAHRDLSRLCATVAYCHHMRDGGFGYPNPKVRMRPGPVTEVIQVADMLEALTGHRPYRAPMSFGAAVQTIRATPGMASRAAALDLLARTLGDLAPGANVRLDSGERATVVGPGASADAAQPIVRLTADRADQALGQTVLRDLSEAHPPRRIVARILPRAGVPDGP